MRNLLLLPLVCTPALAQCEFQLLAADKATDDLFGIAVDVDGDTAVIGAYLDHHAGLWSGSAYVFVRSGGAWLQEAKLVPDDIAEGQRFGTDVAVSGDTIVVGAFADDTNGPYAGSAYVFTRSAGVWTQQAKLLPSNAAPYHEFGGAVEVLGDVAVVGAATWESFVDGPGWAVVFERVAGVWTESAVLEPGDPMDGDSFGASLALANGRLYVGAPGADWSLGVTYVFEKTGGRWTQTKKLKPAQLGPNHAFGTSVSADGDWVVAGAPGANGYAGVAHVYVFDGTEWKKGGTLSASDAESGDRFGWAVGVDDGRIAVGAPRERGDCGWECNKGKAYLFHMTADGIGEVQAFTSSDLQQYDYFGEDLAVSGEVLVCGAKYHDVPPNNAGAAYVFSYPTVGTVYCDTNANSTGQRAAIAATGSSLADDGCLHLSASKLPPQQFSYFLMSETADFIPYFSGSQGNLCVGAPIVRFAQDVLDTGDAGVVGLAPDFSDLPQNTVFLPGSTWHFQLWYRDVDPDPTSNTTDGVAVTWQ